MISDKDLAELATGKQIYDYGSLVAFVEQKYNINVEEYRFWHWGLDNILGEIDNGSVVWINWKDALENAVEYDMEKYGKEHGITDICKKFYETYGDKDYKVLVEW